MSLINPLQNIGSSLMGNNVLTASAATGAMPQQGAATAAPMGTPMMIPVIPIAFIPISAEQAFGGIASGFSTGVAGGGAANITPTIVNFSLPEIPSAVPASLTAAPMMMNSFLPVFGNSLPVNNSLAAGGVTSALGAFPASSMFPMGSGSLLSSALIPQPLPSQAFVPSIGAQTLASPATALPASAVLQNSVAQNPLSQSAFQSTSVETMMMTLMQSIMNLMMTFFSVLGLPGNSSSGAGSAGSGLGSNPGDLSSAQPLPYYAPPPPPPVTPPVLPPPPPAPTQIKGAAGFFGDPKFGLFTPGLAPIPEALKSFESGLTTGVTAIVLKDPDGGGFQVETTGVQVDPANVNSTGIGQAVFRSGADVIAIRGNGDLLVNDVLKGNINDSGTIAPIQLPSGMTVATAPEIDSPNGETAERFVITNGEYKITAAARKPHPDSSGYLDMNFEERTVNAADNAAGYRAPFGGLPDMLSIPDLLRLEPGDLG